MHKQCQHCKEEFYAQKTNAQYCSSNCRQKAYLKRKKEDTALHGAIAETKSKSHLPSSFHGVYADFQVHGNEQDAERDQVSNFGSILGGYESLQEVHLSDNKLIATEDLAHRLLREYDEPEALYIIKHLQNDGLLVPNAAETLISLVKYENEPSLEGLHCCLDQTCKAFRALLLFDRQFVPIPFILTLLDELGSIVHAVTKRYSSSTEEAFLQTIRLQMANLLKIGNSKNEVLFGLSFRMRSVLQTFLMTK